MPSAFSTSSPWPTPNACICREQQLLPLVNAALDKIPQWSDFHTVVKRCRHTNNAGLIGAYYAFETEVEGMEKVPIR